MSHLDYKDAQKQGVKEFRACTARGQYPYLLALEDFVPRERINQGIDLGAIQIPMEFIVGGRAKVDALVDTLPGDKILQRQKIGVLASGGAGAKLL